MNFFDPCYRPRQCSHSIVSENTIFIDCAVTDHLGILHTTDVRFHLNEATEIFRRDFGKYRTDDYHCSAFFSLFSDLKKIENEETKRNPQDQFLKFHDCLVDCVHKYYH